MPHKEQNLKHTEHIVGVHCVGIIMLEFKSITGDALSFNVSTCPFLLHVARSCTLMYNRHSSSYVASRCTEAV